MTAWQWLKSAPRWLVLVAAVAVTWGCWLAHVVGTNLERARWENRKIEKVCPSPLPRRSKVET